MAPMTQAHQVAERIGSPLRTREDVIHVRRMRATLGAEGMAIQVATTQLMPM